MIFKRLSCRPGGRPASENLLTLARYKLGSATAMRFGINTFLFTSPFTNESTKLFQAVQEMGL